MSEILKLIAGILVIFLAVLCMIAILAVLILVIKYLINEKRD